MEEPEITEPIKIVPAIPGFAGKIIEKINLERYGVRGVVAVVIGYNVVKCTIIGLTAGVAAEELGGNNYIETGLAVGGLAFVTSASLWILAGSMGVRQAVNRILLNK